MQFASWLFHIVQLESKQFLIVAVCNTEASHCVIFKTPVCFRASYKIRARCPEHCTIVISYHAICKIAVCDPGFYKTTVFYYAVCKIALSYLVTCKIVVWYYAIVKIAR